MIVLKVLLMTAGFLLLSCSVAAIVVCIINKATGYAVGKGLNL